MFSKRDISPHVNLPSFFSGMRSLIDSMSQLHDNNFSYMNPQLPNTMDSEALRYDWEKVGQDFHKAMDNSQKIR